MATEQLFVTISKNSPNLVAFDIVKETAKAFLLKNREHGAQAWLPKSWLKPRKPGVPSYEDEYILSFFGRSNLSRHQEIALDILEV